MVGDTAQKHKIKMGIPSSVGWSATFQQLAEILISAAAFVCKSCATAGHRQCHWTVLPVLRNQQPQMLNTIRIFGGELHVWDTDSQVYTHKQWLLVPLIMLSCKVLISQGHTYTLKFTYCKLFH